LSGELNDYRVKCLGLVASFKTFIIDHVSREGNTRANALAQQASRYIIRWGKFGFLQRPATETVLVIQGENEVVVDDGQADNNDWRRELMNYISNPGSTRDRKIQRQTLKYTIIEGILHRRTSEGLSLKCLSKEEAKVTVGEVHEGMCGAHQDVHKMKWLLRRSGVYWSSMLVDCFKYAKGCEACQQFGKLQIASASMLHPIIKPWPFRGWSLDFIGEVHPASMKGHQFVLMATDYFTKWAEAVPLKNMAHQELI
jgi:hypothetical protein